MAGFATGYGYLVAGQSCGLGQSAGTGSVRKNLVGRSHVVSEVPNCWKWLRMGTESSSVGLVKGFPLERGGFLSW